MNNKLKNIVLYICNKIPARNLGLLRMHKILWFADLLNYMETGDTITGEKYVKAPNGPIASHLKGTLKQLETDGVISWVEPAKSYQPHLISANAMADMLSLSVGEMENLNAAIKFAADNLTKTLSEMTHGMLWQNLPDGADMPIEVAAAELCMTKTPYEEINWELHGN